MLISQFPDDLLKAWDSCAVFFAESRRGVRLIAGQKTGVTMNRSRFAELCRLHKT
jgi:hypothetical protein